MARGAGLRRTAPPRVVLRSVVLRSAIGWVLVAVVLWAAVLPPERCPDVTVDDLRASAAEAVGWFERNQHPDGRWLYRYDAEADADLGDYNLVRHAGVTMSLYQAHAAGHGGALASADAGADHALRNLVEVGDGMAFGPSTGDVPVGASALLLAGLAERRQATGDRAHDDDLRAMGRFLTAMTKESGAVIAYWDRVREQPTTDDPSPFFTGEVYWALALLHRELPGEGWDATAARIGTYIATERDEVEGWFPDISDHWAAYGLSTQAAWLDGPGLDSAGLDGALGDYAERQSGIAGFQVRWESQRTDEWPNTVVRGGRTLGAGLGTLGEQLNGLWRVSTERSGAGDRDLVAPLTERARCVAGMLVERQVSPAEAERYDDPGRTRGAWFQRGITQMDDQQHAMSAVLLAEPIVASQPVRVDEPWGAGAPRALLLAALVLVLNPVRAAAALRGGTRQERLAATGAGAAVSVVVLAAVAAAGRPLLDALDVSAPTLRIGAGLVLVVTAVADMVRGRAAHRDADRPELPGWRAGLVPLAVPALLRPASLVLALSAGVDAGVGLVVLGAAVALACVAALAAVPAPRDGSVAGVVHDWATRLLAAALLVLAIALAVDGVYDV